MLAIDVFRYLRSRLDKRPVHLKNLTSAIHHHEFRVNEPSVSIIIPSRDKYELLHACIETLLSKTTYRNYGLIIVNNDSTEKITLDYLEELRGRGIKVIDYPHTFNYSKICNLAAKSSDSEYLCFLNNDTEIIEGGWLKSMMAHAIQPGAGVIGSKLLYPNGTIQHLGIALGFKGVAGHAFSGLAPSDSRLGKAAEECFEVSAVTFACALVSKANYLEVSGLDPIFRVGLNDVDFALRLLTVGKKNIVCGSSPVIHLESRTRRSAESPRGAFQAFREIRRLYVKHRGRIEADSYFSR